MLAVSTWAVSMVMVSMVVSGGGVHGGGFNGGIDGMLDECNAGMQCSKVMLKCNSKLQCWNEALECDAAMQDCKAIEFCRWVTGDPPAKFELSLARFFFDL